MFSHVHYHAIYNSQDLELNLCTQKLSEQWICEKIWYIHNGILLNSKEKIKCIHLLLYEMKLGSHVNWNKPRETNIEWFDLYVVYKEKSIIIKSIEYLMYWNPTSELSIELRFPRRSGGQKGPHSIAHYTLVLDIGNRHSIVILYSYIM